MLSKRECIEFLEEEIHKSKKSEPCIHELNYELDAEKLKEIIKQSLTGEEAYKKSNSKYCRKRYKSSSCKWISKC